jgi:hypothetical protein
MPPLNNTTKPSPSKIEQEVQEMVQEKRQEITENNLRNVAVDGSKSQFIKMMVEENRGLFWSVWKEMMSSSDKNERRAAMIEYNKLQARMLPTEITSPDGEGLIVKIVNYAAQAQNNALDEPDFIDCDAEPEPEETEEDN